MIDDCNSGMETINTTGCSQQGIVLHYLCLFAVMFVTVQQYGKMAADNGMKLSGYIHPFINTHKAAMIIKYKNTQSTMNRKKYTKGIK